MSVNMGFFVSTVIVVLAHALYLVKHRKTCVFLRSKEFQMGIAIYACFVGGMVFVVQEFWGVFIGVVIGLPSLAILGQKIISDRINAKRQARRAKLLNYINNRRGYVRLNTLRREYAFGFCRWDLKLAAIVTKRSGNDAIFCYLADILSLEKGECFLRPISERSKSAERDVLFHLNLMEKILQESPPCKKCSSGMVPRVSPENPRELFWQCPRCVGESLRDEGSSSLTFPPDLRRQLLPEMK